MSLYEQLSGIAGSLFQIGFGGPKWKNNGGALEARNPTDAGFVVVRGAAPVGADDFVTLGSLPTSTTGVVRSIRFAITTTATQTSTALLPANAVVLRATLNVVTPYSVATTITIGQVGALTLLQAATDNLATAAGLYLVPQETDWGAVALAVVATIAGAPAAGAGFVTVEYTNPDA